MRWDFLGQLPIYYVSPRHFISTVVYSSSHIDNSLFTCSRLFHDKLHKNWKGGSYIEADKKVSHIVNYYSSYSPFLHAILEALFFDIIFDIIL